MSFFNSKINSFNNPEAFFIFFLLSLFPQISQIRADLLLTPSFYLRSLGEGGSTFSSISDSPAYGRISSLCWPVAGSLKPVALIPFRSCFFCLVSFVFYLVSFIFGMCFQTC